jgi:hypothetical protein
MTTQTTRWLKLVLGGMAICLMLGCAAHPAAAEEPVNLQGIYRDGQSDVRITKNGGVYQIRWDFPNGQCWIGVGLVSDKTFSVAWDLPRGGNLGVCAFRIEKGQAGPKLVGHWAAYQDNRATEETLIFMRK